MPNEQPNPEWSDWKQPQKIVELCGIGLVWYQKYLQSLILLNGVLCIISLIPIGAHIYAGSRSFEVFKYESLDQTSNTSIQTSNTFASVVFLWTTASYPQWTHPYIYMYMGLFVVVLMIHFFLYRRFLKVEYIQGQSTRITSETIYGQQDVSNHHQLFESPVDQELLQIGPDVWETSEYHKNISLGRHQWIQIQDKGGLASGMNSSVHQTSLSQVLKKSDEWAWFKRRRNAVSITCFGIVLGAYGVSLWALQTYMYAYFNHQASDITIHIWISLLLSIIQAFTDLVWLVVCELLRYLEVHQTDEIGRKWQCVRLFLLRVFSINVFYLVRTYVLKNELQCSADLLGIQHVLIIVSYILGDLTADFAWPWIYRLVKRCGRHYERDYETWYEFDLSEQYAAIAFRHMLLCCGASFMPGLSFVALIGHYIQLKADQYRLCHLTRLKRKVQSSYHKFLVLQGITTLITFLFFFPKGVLWIFIYPDSFFTCDLLATA